MTHLLWQGAQKAQPGELPYQQLFETLPGMYLILTPQLQIIAANNSFLRKIQKQRDEVLGRYFFDIFSRNSNVIKANQDMDLATIFRKVLSSRQIHSLAIPPYCQAESGRQYNFPESYWQVTNSVMLDEQGEIAYVIHQVIEVPKTLSNQHLLEEISPDSAEKLNIIDNTIGKEHVQNTVEEKNIPVNHELTQQAAEKYRTLFNSMDEGFCILELIFNQDQKPIDFRYIETNPVFEQQTGMKNALGKTIRELVPDIEPFWFDIYGNVALTGEPTRFEDYAQSMGRWFNVNAFRIGKPEDRQVAVLFNDTTQRKRAEEALRESEARFRIMADTVPQSIWITDAEGRTEFLNKHWCDYCGVPYEPTTAAEIAANFIHPDDAPNLMAVFNQSMRTGTPFEIEQRNRSAKGEYRWFLNRANPYYDPKTGKILKWFGVGVDIHDRKMAEEALQESEERFRTMAEASGILIAQTDEAGNAIYFNGEWLKLTGRTMEELINFGWADFLHPEDRESFVEAYKNAFQQRSVLKREFRLKSQDGEYRWQLAIISPRFGLSRRFAGYISSCIDITEQKQAEQKLQELSEQLVATNQELLTANEELISANDQLKHINADLDNFIYTASHDLKAPISNIDGLMKVLSRKIHKQTGYDDQLEKIIAMMEASIIRFQETIHDLTDIARIQKQMDQEAEQVDLLEIVQATLLDLSPQVEESGARIETHLEECPAIMFPRKNPKSVVYNLLSNAIKYRDPHRTLHIKISCYQEGDYLLLSVQDNGLGLDTSDENKIFGMFKRMHAHVEGTGVGLYIVKKMVENAGGKIEVESRVGEGSTFKVYFRK